MPNSQSKPVAPVRNNVVQLEDIIKNPIITDSYAILTTDALHFKDMLLYLTEGRKGYVEVEGGYLMQTGEENKQHYVTERAVIVSLATALDLGRQGWLVNQESILHIYNKDIRNWYRAELVYLGGDIEPVDLGWLREVDEETALANPEGYTFRPTIDGDFDSGKGTYFAALSTV